MTQPVPKIQVFLVAIHVILEICDPGLSNLNISVGIFDCFEMNSCSYVASGMFSFWVKISSFFWYIVKSGLGLELVRSYKMIRK